MRISTRLILYTGAAAGLWAIVMNGYMFGRIREQQTFSQATAHHRAELASMKRHLDMYMDNTDWLTVVDNERKWRERR